MNDSVFGTLAPCFKNLKLDMTPEELAVLSSTENFSPQQLAAISRVIEYLDEKKKYTTVSTLLRLSKLPLKSPKTFENFDFSTVKGKNIEKLQSLPSLAPIYAHKNLAFIGPAGTGKTHLAQAFGYACCQNCLKTYFIKMTELRDKFNQARKTGKESSVLNGLVRPSCLIIDEVGHCDFDKENTRLFFDLIDRRYNKEGSFNIVFTSNKNPLLWRENFADDDSLLCSLDRIFDEAIVFTFQGESYRGRKTEHISLKTGKVSSPETSENQI